MCSASLLYGTVYDTKSITSILCKVYTRGSLRGEAPRKRPSGANPLGSGGSYSTSRGPIGHRPKCRPPSPPPSSHSAKRCCPRAFGYRPLTGPKARKPSTDSGVEPEKSNCRGDPRHPHPARSRELPLSSCVGPSVLLGERGSRKSRRSVPLLPTPVLSTVEGGRP